MGKIILISEKQPAKDLLIFERRVRKLFKEHKYAPGEYIYPECIRKYIKQMKTRKIVQSEETDKLNNKFVVDGINYLDEDDFL